MNVKQLCSGVFRITLDVGLPYESNAYLIDRGITTLIDPGAKLDSSLNGLQKGLIQAGRSIQDIRRILLTHIHWDHFGAARKVTETSRSGNLLCFEDARSTLEGYEDDIRKLIEYRSALLVRSGVPISIIEKIIFQMKYLMTFAESAKPHDVFVNGDEFSLGKGSLRVIHTPGHTSTCVSFYLPDEKILFCGDLLLQHMMTFFSPLPIDRTIYQSVRAFRQSLDCLHYLPLNLMLPGHGPAIRGYKVRVEETIRYILDGKENMVRILRGKKKTPFQLHEALCAISNPFTIYRGIAEITAYLDALVGKGLVGKDVKDGVDYFYLHEF